MKTILYLYIEILNHKAIRNVSIKISSFPLYPSTNHISFFLFLVLILFVSNNRRYEVCKNIVLDNSCHNPDTVCNCIVDCFRHSI